MTIWRHSECSYIVSEGEQTPSQCPASVIPHCENPTAGFNLTCQNTNPKVWECKSCGWQTESATTPSTCPAGSSIPACPNPQGGEYEFV